METNRTIDPKNSLGVENYKFRSYGDDSPWPGPNSNTFIQTILDAFPELNTVLPATAIGKDPAVGSSVLITACTDSGGFFIFLGLATLFLV